MESMSDRGEQIAEEARRWLARLASGAMQADELERFKAWRAAAPEHDAAFRRQRALWREVSSIAGAFGASEPAPARKPAWRRPAILAIAATVLFALALPHLGLMLRADHRTGSEVARLSLPDGSTAVLDAGSAVAVDFGAGERRVRLLRGGAWFQVRHGDTRPFRVAAMNGVTEDIGTAFEVRRNGDTVEVAVTEGSVRVAAGSHEALVLDTAQRARYGEGQAPVREADGRAGDIAPWRHGEILLDRVTVRTAVEEIGRYVPGIVLLAGEPAGAAPVSGVFRTDRTEEALEAIARMTGLTVRRWPGVTILRPAA